jgi:hypothetical protein
MEVLEIDTSQVHWPKTLAVREAMGIEIRRLAKEQGYTHFGTMTLRCLNGIESPDPDPPGPPGWENMGFFPDCEPDQVNDDSSVYNDVRLFARKTA